MALRLEPCADRPADLLALGDAVALLDRLETLGQVGVNVEVIELPHMYNYIIYIYTLCLGQSVQHVRATESTWTDRRTETVRIESSTIATCDIEQTPGAAGGSPVTLRCGSY